METYSLLIIANNLDRAGYKQRIGVYRDIFEANGIRCSPAQLPHGFWGRYRLFRRAREFDGVLLHKKGLNSRDAWILKKYARKVIYHFDDAIMYSPKHPEKESPVHARPFYRSVRLADLVITCSEYLADHARRQNEHVAVLPSGLNIADYRPGKFEKPRDGKIRLVWIGSLSTLEYLKALKPMLETLGRRRRDLVLRIICDDFFDLESMPVEKCRWEKQTRVEHLAACDIGLAPLPDNRFTRGKGTFKILEYAAAGLPVIASPVGVHAQYIQDGVTGFLAADETAWIERVTQLAEDGALRRQMGQANLQQAEQFDVSVLWKEFTALIKNCLRQ